MTKPYDLTEEAVRREEYSAILRSLHLSEVSDRADPDSERDIPARILRWQYAEGLLMRRQSGDAAGLEAIFTSADERAVAERRHEYAQRLSIFLVADEARMSEEYLRKLYSKFDYKGPSRSPGIPIIVE